MDFIFTEIPPTILPKQPSPCDPWDAPSVWQTVASMIPILHPITGLFSMPGVSLSMAPIAATAAPSLDAAARVHLYTPREESFAELIFPGFEPDALIWSISLFQIAEFLFSVAVTSLGGPHGAPTPPGMPSPCTLYKLGASWGPSIASGQLHRLLLPMTLHANMMHLFFNIFFQLRMGFNMEKCWGRQRFLGPICFSMGVSSIPRSFRRFLRSPG